MVERATYNAEDALNKMKELLEKKASSDEIADALGLYKDSGIEYSLIHRIKFERGAPTGYFVRQVVDSKASYEAQHTGLDRFKSVPAKRFTEE